MAFKNILFSNIVQAFILALLTLTILEMFWASLLPGKVLNKFLFQLLLFIYSFLNKQSSAKYIDTWNKVYYFFMMFLALEHFRKVYTIDIIYCGLSF